MVCESDRGGGAAEKTSMRLRYKVLGFKLRVEFRIRVRMTDGVRWPWFRVHACAR